MARSAPQSAVIYGCHLSSVRAYSGVCVGRRRAFSGGEQKLVVRRQGGGGKSGGVVGRGR